MPRKTQDGAVIGGVHEAASMRPRPDAAENTLIARGFRGGPGGASMRPRPDAAENVRVIDWPRIGVTASMRPRPDAAENAGVAPGAVRRGIASMRPRPDAAENLRGPGRGDRGTGRASMRPRPDAAENDVQRGNHAARHRCFNEAAARCRGKRDPRREAAEGEGVLQ